ncbi:hypothetical protein F01_520250 [Burkholderia cenocepacia]|nr:hypothetical protein F01_520250 [Burkholderia cenocepacia]
MAARVRARRAVAAAYHWRTAAARADSRSRTVAPRARTARRRGADDGRRPALAGGARAALAGVLRAVVGRSRSRRAAVLRRAFAAGMRGAARRVDRHGPRADQIDLHKDGRRARRATDVARHADLNDRCTRARRRFDLSAADSLQYLAGPAADGAWLTLHPAGAAADAARVLADARRVGRAFVAGVRRGSRVGGR